MADGLTYKAIGTRIGYTRPGVVKVTIRIFSKLNAHNPPHAVFRACQLRILDPARRHGDHAGYAAHVYRDEDPCDACKEGERVYRAERRAARKARKSTAAQPGNRDILDTATGG
jgi:hypothetical protein